MHLSTSASISLAALLVLTGFVQSANPRQYEVFDNPLVQDLDDTEMGPQKALALIDRLCGQLQPEDEDIKVSGAINVLTWDFLPWAEYIHGPGAGQDITKYYAAHAPWQTFNGSCFFNQYGTWYEDGETSTGTVRTNLGWVPQTRRLPIKIQVPGFSGMTSLPSMLQRVQNPLSVLSIFRDLDGLPEDLLFGWVGFTQSIYPQEIYKEFAPRVPACTEAWITATIVERFVRVLWTFHVETYNYNSALEQGSVGSWRNKGYEWQYVWSTSGWVDGRGVARQLPTEDSYFNTEPHYLALPPDECKARPSNLPPAKKPKRPRPG
jgi:hypothetical protein